jgi:hypothetical protein
MLLIPIEILVGVKEEAVEAVATGEEDVTVEVVEDEAEAVEEVVEESGIDLILWGIGVHVQESTTMMNGANYPMTSANEFMIYAHLLKVIVL